jgi:hypothetical protein
MLGPRLLTAFLLITSVALFAGEKPDSESGKAASETLLTQAREMLNEIFENMKSERRLPPTITDAELAKRVQANLDMLKSTHSFDVTPAQEEAFKKGEFDDARNLEQIGQAISDLKKSKIDLPAQSVYAMRHYEAKDLKGARLEMCLRVVQYNVTKIRSLLGDNEPAKRSK